jgi:flagellar biosynthetic protein FliR
MSWLLQIDMEKLLLFTLVLTRVGGLTMTAPIYGTKDIPMQVRALLAVALAALITPSQWNVAVDYSGSVFQYLIFIGGELLIGLSLGMGIVILFSGIQLAGQLIGRVSGLMLADVFDPAVGVSVPLFSRLLFFVSMAVFVCIGGHRMVMAALLDTFQAIPPGGGGLPLSVAAALEELLAQSFSLGIRAAAPMVTAVLLSTLVLGLISRTLPQLNILAVGFGLNSMLTSVG